MYRPEVIWWLDCHQIPRLCVFVLPFSLHFFHLTVLMVFELQPLYLLPFIRKEEGAEERAPFFMVALFLEVHMPLLFTSLDQNSANAKPSCKGSRVFLL